MQTQNLVKVQVNTYLGRSVGLARGKGIMKMKKITKITHENRHFLVKQFCKWLWKISFFAIQQLWQKAFCQSLWVLYHENTLKQNENTFINTELTDCIVPWLSWSAVIRNIQWQQDRIKVQEWKNALIVTTNELAHNHVCTCIHTDMCTNKVYTHPLSPSPCRNINCNK